MIRCCFFTSLFFFGPRLAFLVFWLFPWGRVKVAAAFDTFILPLLGLIFLPWTTLAYSIVFPVANLDLVWIGLALVADIAGYAFGNRSRKDF